MRIRDSIVFSCTKCGKRGGPQMAVLLEDFSYIFVLVCECGTENHINLNDLLKSLCPITAERKKGN